MEHRWKAPDLHRRIVTVQNQSTQVNVPAGNLMVEADLVISIDESDVRVVGEGKVLSVNFESGSDFWELPSRRLKTIENELQDWLTQSGLTLSVNVRDREIARVGAQANSSFITRFFSNMDHLQLRFTNILLEYLNYFTR